MKKSLFQVAVALTILAYTTTPALAQSLLKGTGGLRVMTYNVNEGTDFLEIQQATTAQQFLVAVGETITNVRATQPPARMQALAKQILAASPSLVGLQELDQWLTGPLDMSTFTCGGTSMEFDMLKELQDALTAQGGHYRVAVQAQQYAFPPIPGVTASGFLCVQVVNSIAILARTDADPLKFTWSNPQSGQYASTLYFPSPVGTLPLPRAWASVDAASHGQTFRFITTHLESVVPAIRQAQGVELRTGPANTSLPVVLAMDSNAQAAPLPLDSAYLDFRNAGYVDGWANIFPSRAGFTCCQAELDNNPVSQLYQRIDLILTFGSVSVENIALYGGDPASKTPRGLWASDHAGVAAQLELDSE